MDTFNLSMTELYNQALDKGYRVSYDKTKFTIFCYIDIEDSTDDEIKEFGNFYKYFTIYMEFGKFHGTRPEKIHGYMSPSVFNITHSEDEQRINLKFDVDGRNHIREVGFQYILNLINIYNFNWKPYGDEE